MSYLTALSLKSRPQVRGRTVDIKDPHEIDDAINVARLPDGGYLLQVHIADAVSSIDPYGPEVERAKELVFAQYGMRRHTPIFPIDLINDALTLRSGTRRPAVTTEVRFSAEFEIVEHRIYRSCLEVQGNFTYEGVGIVLLTETPQASPFWFLAYELAEKLFEKRMQCPEAAVFDIEKQLIAAEDGRVRRMRWYEAFRAHLIVQECMILNNLLNAKLAQELGLPILYRNHSGGIENDTSSLDDDFEEQPDDADLRSCPLASFDLENRGHIGLRLPVYARFSSPLRSCPDYFNQAALCAALDGTEYPYTPATVSQLVVRANEVDTGTRQKRLDAQQRHKDWLGNATLNQLNRIDDRAFSLLLAQVAKGNFPLTTSRQLAMNRRILNGRLQMRDITRILFSPLRDPRWDYFKQAALAWLKLQPESIMNVLSDAEVVYGWPSRDEIQWTTNFSDGYYIVTATYRRGDSVLPAVGEGRRILSEARRSAAISLIQLLSGVPFPSPKQFSGITKSTVGPRDPHGVFRSYLDRLPSGIEPVYKISSPRTRHGSFKAGIELTVNGLKYWSGECLGFTEEEAVRAAKIALLARLPKIEREFVKV